MTGRAWLADPRYRRFHLAMLLACPVLQMAANPGAFINPGGGIDSWVNTGFFLSLPRYATRFGYTYYSTRLSWLFPGFVAHTLLPPLAANYALHLTFFYALLWATYQFLASGVDRSTAIIGTLFVAWHTYILMAYSSDYVDGAGIVFLMLILLSLERAVQGRHQWRWLFAAGGAAACLVVANMTLLALLPACGVFLLLRAEPSRLRSIVPSLTAAVAGAVAMLFIFGALNRSFGGNWLFLEPSIRFGQAMFSQTNPWRTVNFNWNRAAWLAVPAFSGVGSILTLVFTPPGGRRFARAVQAASLTAIATWLLFDVVTHTALLQYTYYASYLAPLALIALPLQFEGRQPDSDLRSAVAFDLSVFTALLTAHLGFLWYGQAFWGGVSRWLDPIHPPNHLMLVTSITTTVGGLAVLSMWVIRRPRLRWSLFVAAIAFSAAGPHYWPGISAGARARFETVVEAHRFIARHLDHQPVRFWYRATPDDSPPLRPIASTYLWGWVLVNEELPRLAKNEAITLQSDARLVMLIARRAELDDARAALKPFGWDYVIVDEQPFSVNRQTFTVVIADLTRTPQGS